MTVNVKKTKQKKISKAQQDLGAIKNGLYFV